MGPAGPKACGPEPEIIYLIVDDFDDERAAWTRGHLLSILKVLLKKKKTQNTFQVLVLLSSILQPAAQSYELKTNQDIRH